MNNNFNNLEPIEKDIVNYLKNYCNGLSHSISNEALAAKFQMDKRTLRSLITHLIVFHDVPLGSCSRNHSGIFYVSSQYDFEVAHREIISRIKNLSKRAKHLRLGYYESIKDKQLQLI